eukprot:7311633-Prymnesium_polylepis.1
MLRLLAVALLASAARAVLSGALPLRSPTAGALRHRPCLLAVASSLADLKVYELKAVCRAKGLKVSGRKAELIARIEAAPLGVAKPSASKKRAASGKRAAAASKRPPAAADVGTADAPVPAAVAPGVE